MVIAPPDIKVEIAGSNPARWQPKPVKTKGNIMDKETMHKHHRLIWAGAVAEKFGTNKNKRAFAERQGFDFKYGCSACQYVLENHKITPDVLEGECKRVCPLCWGEGRSCSDTGTVFAKWVADPTQANALAVLNVPLREPEKPEIEYPCHMKSSHTGNIYLVAKPRTGDCVFLGGKNQNSHKIGEHIVSLHMPYLTPCDKPEEPEETFAVGDTVEIAGWPGLYKLHTVDGIDKVALVHINSDNTLSGTISVKDCEKITSAKLRYPGQITKLKGHWEFIKE